MKKDLRNFGVLFGSLLVCFFGAIIPLIFKSPYPLWPWVFGSSSILISLLAPMVLRPVYLVWMALGNVLGHINTRLILGLFFFLVMTPIALVFKLIGRDPMARSFVKEAETYRCFQTIRTKMENPF